METDFSDMLVEKYNQPELENEQSIRVYKVWRVPNRERNLLGMVTLEINQLFLISRIQVYRDGRVIFPKDTNAAGNRHRIFEFRRLQARRLLENIVIAGMDAYIRNEEPRDREHQQTADFTRAFGGGRENAMRRARVNIIGDWWTQ